MPTPRTRGRSPRASISRCRGATRSTPTVCFTWSQRRRDAGDASEMDVELARVTRRATGERRRRRFAHATSRRCSICKPCSAWPATDSRSPSTDSLVPPPAAPTPRRPTLNESAARAVARIRHGSARTAASLDLVVAQSDRSASSMAIPSQPGILPTVRARHRRCPCSTATAARSRKPKPSERAPPPS